MKHFSTFYENLSDEVEQEMASARHADQKRTRLYDTLSDLVWNHTPPFCLIGAAPVKLQQHLRENYRACKMLDPKRASVSSGIWLSALGYLFTRLSGDGSIGLTYNYPQILFGEEVTMPVYVPIIGNWTPAATQTFAYVLMADAAARILYGLKGKPMAFGRPAFEMMESSYRSVCAMLGKNSKNDAVHEVKRKQGWRKRVTGSFLGRLEQSREKEQKDIKKRLSGE